MIFLLFNVRFSHIILNFAAETFKNTTMKRLVLLFVALVAMAASAQEIATWEGFRKGAASFTFDQGAPCHISDVGPMFEEYGYRATFYLVSYWNPDWKGFQSLADNGHEIGSNSNSHGQYMEGEEASSKSYLNGKITQEYGVLTAAYPNGNASRDLTAMQQNYIAGRLVMGDVMGKDGPDNWYKLPAIMTGSSGLVVGTQDFTSKMQEAINKGGWVVFLTHGLSGKNNGNATYSPTDPGALGGALKWASYHDDIWIAPLRSVVMYIRERNASAFKEVGSTSDTRTYTLTHNIANEICQFNYPLSLRVRLPDGWTVVTVAQDNKILESEIKDDGNIYFKAIPNRGDIQLFASAVVRFPPSDVEVSDVTPTGAKLEWTEHGETTAWQVSVNGSIVNVRSNPCYLSLKQNTDYKVQVRSVYDAETNDYSDWSEPCLFTTPIANPVPADVAVTTTPTSATITWKGTSDSYKVRYRKALSSPFFDDFENGLDAQGWTSIRQGDGNENTVWQQHDGSTISGGSNYSGDCVAMSRSWNNNVAYDVDNWLITPKVRLDGTLKYWVRDSGNYHDHYDVYVSTTGKDISDFQLLYAPGSASETWTQVTVDLNTFGGQMGYIAFRHKDFDNEYLMIDDVSIGYTAAGDSWIVTETTKKKVTLTDLEPDTTYEYEVIGVVAEQEDASAGIGTFTTLVSNPVPTDIAVNAVGGGVAIYWTGYADQYKVEYRTPGANGRFSDDFENGLDKWTIYTNGEAPAGEEGWSVETNNAHGGSYQACSKSWMVGGSGTAFDADNWLITPRLNLQGGTLKFWEKASDPNYPDQFSVLVSLKSNAVEDFTKVARTKKAASGTWTEVSIDMNSVISSGFGNWDIGGIGGMDGVGYIAIRHKDKDKCHLHIDDFSFEGNTIVEGPWRSKTTNDTQILLNGLMMFTTYECRITAIKNGSEATTDIFTFKTGIYSSNIELDDCQDNNATIESKNGTIANVTIKNRTLKKDGTWQSICLPFDINVEASILRGADVRTLESVTVKGNVGILNCLTPVTEMKAGTPYIIRWESGTDIVNPVFESVVIKNGGESSQTEFASFLSTSYKHILADQTYTDCYHMTPGSPLLMPVVANTEIFAFDGIFLVNSTSFPQVNEFVVYTGEEDDFITGVSPLLATEDEPYYNVLGQRLNKPQKGIYIRRGKKVLVK